MHGDEGNALVEFVVLGVLVLVPLVYVVLTVFQVQRHAYALTSAAREGGRVFVLASSGDEAFARAETAIRISLADQGVDADAVGVDFRCSQDPCLSPGGRVDVLLRARAPLPLVPASLGGSPTSVEVSARQTAVVDSYREARP